VSAAAATVAGTHTFHSSYFYKKNENSCGATSPPGQGGKERGRRFRGGGSEEHPRPWIRRTSARQAAVPEAAALVRAPSFFSVSPPHSRCVFLLTYKATHLLQAGGAEGGGGAGGGGQQEDDDIVVTSEAGQDWMSMPHQRHLCRKAPFNAATCDNCWSVQLQSITTTCILGNPPHPFFFIFFHFHLTASCTRFPSRRCTCFPSRRRPPRHRTELQHRRHLIFSRFKYFKHSSAGASCVTSKPPSVPSGSSGRRGARTTATPRTPPTGEP
jgi:hypothetical protein